MNDVPGRGRLERASFGAKFWDGRFCKNLSKLYLGHFLGKKHVANIYAFFLITELPTIWVHLALVEVWCVVLKKVSVAKRRAP